MHEMDIRLNEVNERSPCLGDGDAVDVTMLKAKRRVLLDVLMASWGLSSWLGVNGFFVQLPLLVERLPEGWALPSSMTVAVQAANVGLLLYAALRRLLPAVNDAVYIVALLVTAALALIVNAFAYMETATIGGSERSVAFLVSTFIVGLVGCTSSVLFYPYLRHFRDVYLATYLVGEGLSGFIPSILSLIQGVGGAPECVPSADNSTLEAVYPPARFDPTVFMLVLGALAIGSVVSFLTIDRSKSFASERVSAAAADKSEEAARPTSVLRPRWLGALALVAALNALANGVLPSVQSYSCMPYGARAYHLAVSLSTMANPLACLAGVWLAPAPAPLLAALLLAAAPPLAYILATALLSPAPPLLDRAGGEVLVVASWVCVVALVSYGRMWLLGWARRGGARGMRACGAAGQLGSALGSVLLFALVNYTHIFTQPAACPPPPLQ